MSTTTNQTPDDQLTPRDVILKLIEIKDALLGNWKILILFILLGFGIGYAMDTYLKKPLAFEANIVFNLGGGAGPGMGGMGNMASLLNMGSTPDANIFSGENFFYFVKSRPVLERTLMKQVTIFGKKMLLANLYIDSSGIKTSEWKDRADLQTFHFATNKVDSMDIPSRRILNELVTKAKGATDVEPLDRKSSFITLAATVENESLAVLWVQKLLETIQEVYTENQTQKTRKTLSLLQRRADSLAIILGKTEYILARQLDMSAQVIVPEAKIAANNMERKSTFLQTLYSESIANVEQLRVSLVREAPLFTKIEDVKVPLDIVSEDKRRAKIGALIGLMLALVFIYFKSVFSSVSKQPVLVEKVTA